MTSTNIDVRLSIKTVLVDPNLVQTIFVIIFLILVMVRTLENIDFLVRSKLRYFTVCNLNVAVSSLPDLLTSDVKCNISLTYSPQTIIRNNFIHEKPR